MDKAEEFDFVRRAKDGDEEAVEALIRAHQDGLYAFILRMSGRPETGRRVVTALSDVEGRLEQPLSLLSISAAVRGPPCFNSLVP